VTSPGEETSAARPALVTAGGLLVAVALLQIGQQVIGVFDPRPAIQAALIVAVGLAALAAERRSAGRAWRGDRIALAAGLGCAAALATAGVVWATAGFSTPSTPTVAEQVDAIRAGLRRDGARVTYRRLRLHQGPPSHVFVAAAPSRSAELRIYDDVRGSLERRLAFRPDVHVPPAGRAVAAAFRVESVRDLDGDGQREILGVYETNPAGAEYQRVPVLISRSSGTARYAIAPLLPVAALGRAAAGLPALRFGSADVVWVADLALDPGRRFVPGQATLATRVVLPRGDPHGLAVTVRGRVPRHVRFWALEGTPTRCVRGGPRTLELASDDVLGEPLADAMAAAGLAVGDYVDGRCLEPAS